MYTFSYTKFDKVKKQTLAGGAAMKRFRMEEIESWRHEGSIHVDNKIVASDCGLLFYDAVV